MFIGGLFAYYKGTRYMQLATTRGGQEGGGKGRVKGWGGGGR